jgi:Disulphide bond corrector protein DsbC
MGVRGKLAGALWLLVSVTASAQMMGPKTPAVSMAPVPPVTVTRGKPAKVNLDFRVVHGFHINSNTPHSEFLIPTTLKLDAPTDIAVGKVVYPEGNDISLPFSPDEKLNVYSGDFTVALNLHPLHTVVPGKYAFHGNLKYQACDNAQCYPPKTLPLNFEVKVVKGTESSGKGNPRQSPHAHR